MDHLSIADILLRLGAAAAAGLVVGLEREQHEKAAGLRTLALVSIGSALLVITAALVAPAEIVRMAAGIATGVGFLGAGAILRERGEVTGLTTAATVWTAAALGAAAAAGAFVLTAFGTALALVVLEVLRLVDLRSAQQDARVYEVTFAGAEWDEAAARRCLAEAGLRTTLMGLAWSRDEVVATWRVVGRWERHEKGIAALRDAPSVRALRVMT